MLQYFDITNEISMLTIFRSPLSVPTVYVEKCNWHARRPLLQLPSGCTPWRHFMMVTIISIIPLYILTVYILNTCSEYLYCVFPQHCISLWWVKGILESSMFTWYGNTFQNFKFILDLPWKLAVCEQFHLHIWPFLLNISPQIYQYNITYFLSHSKCTNLFSTI